MIFTREKNNTSNQNRERCFLKCEKNDTSNQKWQRCVSFAPKFPPFIGACSLQRQCFADIIEKSFSRKIFLVKKWKTCPTLEWNSFVYFSVNEENCRAPAEQQWKGKNRTRRKQVVLFYRTYFVFHLSFNYLSLYSNRPFYLNSFIFNCSFRTKVNITCKFLDYLISLPSLILLSIIIHSKYFPNSDWLKANA